MRIARFSSLLFSTICMRLLTAAVTFTANCNSCHKIFHEILYTQHTHTPHTHHPHPPIGMRNKGNCCKLSRAPETLKRFPNNNNKVVCVFFFVVVVVLVFVRLLCLFSNSIISIRCDSLLEMPISIGAVRIKLNELILFLFCIPNTCSLEGYLYAVDS